MNDLPLNTPLPKPERIEDSPGFLTWQIAMCWQRKINQELGEYAITYTQFIILKAIRLLNQQQESVHQHQVASLARIDRMMTSRVIGNLEKKKMILRAKRSEDGRTNVVILTEKGEKVTTEAAKKVRLMEVIFFSAGANKEKEIVKYLQRILPEC